jgi:hypothetical protein
MKSNNLQGEKRTGEWELVTMDGSVPTFPGQTHSQYTFLKGCCPERAATSTNRVQNLKNSNSVRTENKYKHRKKYYLWTEPLYLIIAYRDDCSY